MAEDRQHQALYRRYRPQTPAEVLGQDHVVRALTGAIRDGRLHHAFLFCGPRGTGKTSTARILAKMVNCATGPTAEPCGGCDQCIAIRDGTHLDVVEIDAASHGGVEDARELREKAPTAPVQGREKVYIIDEAQRLSREAFDALLKVFEEPPPGVRFVLATTEPHKMPATIVGRCQRFDFRRHTMEGLSELLQKVAASEGVTLDDSAAHAIARHAEESARDALSLLDQAGVLGGQKVDDAAIQALLGAPRSEVQVELADGVAVGDARSSFEIINRLVQDGQDLRNVTNETLAHFRDLLLVKTAPGQEDLLDIPADGYEALRIQAEKFSSAELARVIELLLAAQNDMRWTTSPRLSLELALVRATIPETDPSPAGTLARLERLERLANVDPAIGRSFGRGRRGRPRRGPNAGTRALGDSFGLEPATLRRRGPRRGDPGGLRGGAAARRVTGARRPSRRPPAAATVATDAPHAASCGQRRCHDAPPVVAVVARSPQPDRAAGAPGAAGERDAGDVRRRDPRARVPSLVPQQPAAGGQPRRQAAGGAERSLRDPSADRERDAGGACRRHGARRCRLRRGGRGTQRGGGLEASQGRPRCHADRRTRRPRTDPMYEGPIQELIDELARLPGVGPKSAQRLAFWLVKATPEDAKRLAATIVQVKDRIAFCRECGNVADGDLCRICGDESRDRTLICVVEEPKDAATIEKAALHKGRYHILGGAISPLDGIGPDDLRVQELLDRVERDHVTEVILATNPNLEGNATAMYVAALLKPAGIRVTRLASGLPVGGDLEYADEVTLSQAIEGRREV